MGVLRMPKKVYDFEYQVSGAGPFPIDMLRYDRASPMTQADAAALARTFAGPGSHALMLFRTHVILSWEPDYNRWKSFGWEAMTPTIRERHA